MAYDLVTSKDLRRDKKPKCLGCIDSEDYSALESLCAKTNHYFFTRLRDPYKDENFGKQDLIEAQKQLHKLLSEDLDFTERRFAYKLTAIISYALAHDENLYGVAD